MARRQFHLSEEAVDELKRAEQATKRSSELRRMQVVRLYGCGQPMAQIEALSRMMDKRFSDCIMWVARI
jgi:predicted RNase H-like nuclease (RuvC/YqgF family)